MAHYLTNLSKIVRSPAALNINRCGKYLQEEMKNFIFRRKSVRKIKFGEINSSLNHMRANNYLKLF